MLRRKFELIPIKFGFFMIHIHVLMLRRKFELIPIKFGFFMIGSTNNEIAPKQRGLMLRRGQALYVAASGSTALTNGFYCNVQGGFY